jgi:hypothetical protein
MPVPKSNFRSAFYTDAKEAKYLMKHAGIITTWDWIKSPIGETIKEKYESLYCDLVKLDRLLIQNQPHWFIASKHLAFVMETCWSAFTSFPSYSTPDGFWYYGLLNNRWHAYGFDGFEGECLLLGSGDRRVPTAYYARLNVTNGIYDWGETVP